MKKVLTVLMLLLFVNCLNAQRQGIQLIDSLKLRLLNFSEDTGKVRLLGKLSFQYYKFDTDSGIYYAGQAISLSEKIKWGTGIAFSMNYLGTNYAVKGNYSKALECFHNSLDKYTALGDQQGIAFLSNNLANLYRILKEYPKAKEYIIKAIKINTDLKSEIDLIKNYENLGCLYNDSSEYFKSDSCYQKALSIAQKINNKELAAHVLINSSENKIKLKDICEAIHAGIKAIKISEELNIPYDGAIYNGYVGEIFLRLAGDSLSISNKCQFFADNKKIYLLSAKGYLMKSLQLLDKIEDLSVLSDNSLLLSRVYEKLGDADNALKFYKMYSSNKDSVFSKDNSLKLANIEKAQELATRDNKIKIQTLEIKHQNSQIRYQIILFLMILMVVFLILYFYYKTKTESKLRASEEKYRKIFENLQDVFYQIDLTGIILDISPSIERFSEFKREELIGRSVFDFYADLKDRDVFIREITKSGTLINYELKFKVRSGEKFCLVNAQLISDTNGRPVHINGAIRDISLLKQAEEELKESKNKYLQDLVFLKSIFESPIDIIIFALDKEYCYTTFTQFHKRTIKMIWGVDIQIGMNMLEIMSNDTDRIKAKRNFDRALNGEYFIETEEYGDSSLQRTFYEDFYNSIKSPDGNIVGVSVFVIDVTHRKRAEKQLELLNRAIEQSPITVMITDLMGTIEYVNPNFAEVTGYTLDEAIGQNPRILHSGQNSGEFYKELWETILSGKNWSGEFRNKKKNGDLFDESAVISPVVNPDGGISHFVAVKVDITDKKKMVEDLIKAKERAEESDKLKTAFLNNISHEIRTPFNGILGFLSILEYDDLSAAERAEYIGIINKSAERLMNTINEIVEISQIQTGQMNLLLSEVNIRNLGSELAHLFQSEAEELGLELRLGINLPENVKYLTTDNIKLISILSNLIRNAIKFTKEGSIGLSISRKDDFLEFAVSDTGIGIAEDKQSTIFERFMQADISNTRKFDGPGLGLSIAKSYAEMLGGTIRVKSEKGKGSVFCLSIPLSNSDQNNVLSKIHSDETFRNHGNYTGKSLKVLIAEDDEQSALLISISIKNFGTNIIKVGDGVEAVRVCRNIPDIDLVLMDINMAEMDGYEATRQIRQFNTKVVIIAQTAYALTGDREMAIEAGCNDYIAKPIKKDELQELLKQYF